MLRRSLLVLVSLSLIGCKGAVEDAIFGPHPINLGPAPHLILVSGADQVVQVGSELGQPVRVRLLTSTNLAMSESEVKFAFVELGVVGGGISKYTSTNSEGVAEVNFTATRVGAFTIVASFPECIKARFIFCEESVTRTSLMISGTVVAAGG